MTDKEFDDHGKSFRRPTCMKCGLEGLAVFRMNQYGEKGVWWCADCRSKFKYSTERPFCVGGKPIIVP
jgi:ribosomal protein L37AE/L43A